MVDELGDEEMHFDKFLKIANDYYNQRDTQEGIQRIYRLFDNNGTGAITKSDIERISTDLDMFFKPEQLEALFDRASQDGKTITLDDFFNYMYVPLNN